MSVRRRRAAVGTGRGEHGSAIAEFVLVSAVLVPLFFAIVQLALVWHVRTTLVSAASQGARYAAAYDRGLDEGKRRTHVVIDEALPSLEGEQVDARFEAANGQRIVEVAVTARVPTLLLWGPTLRLRVSGHAVEEILP